MSNALSLEVSTRIWCSLIGVGLVVIAGAAVTMAQDRTFTNEEWRADVAEAAAAIREFHPRPFRTITEAEFDSAYERLLSDIPDLTDKEIVVRMAALVGLIDDGHTRLAIPRQHPEIGLEFGHTPTPPPENGALEFAQLPISLERFSDGFFITGSSRQYSDLIGRQVIALGDTPIDDAFDAVQATTFAENDQLASLMGADRLSMPELLRALKIIDASEVITVTLGGGQSANLQPLPVGAIDWVTPFSLGVRPLRFKDNSAKFWSEYLSEHNIVFMQLNEIADGPVPLAQFVTDTIALATNKNAKLVIDIRNNFGGSGGLNKTLVMSLIQSDELNQYDRTFVLTGRRTFSAAQMLVNELEQYTRATFVGEPTGSRPDHYGDPKKIRLANSDLTLRVSRLHWSSYGAFDERDSSYPDIPAYWTSDDYFAGNDPALAAVMSLDAVDLEDLLRRALAREDLHQIGRYTLDSRRAPDTFKTEFSELLLTLGNEFAQVGKKDSASLAYQVGLYFYPEHSRLTQALENLPE